VNSALTPKQWAREWVERLWNRQDGSAIEEMMHPDCVFTEMAGGSWETRGHGPYRRNWELFLSAAPDFHGEFLQLIGDREWFAWTVNCTGTIREATFGADLEGKSFNMICLAMARVISGQCVFAYNFVNFNQPKVILPGWSQTAIETRLPNNAKAAGDKSTEPRKLLDSYVDVVWGGSQRQRLERLVDPSVTIIEAAAYGQETLGTENVLRNSEWFMQQLPDPAIRKIQAVQEGPTAALVFEVAGKITGDGFGQHALGSNASVRGMIVGTFGNDRLVHAYSHMDFNHIGAELPAP
jgi:hypothetical protein